MEYNPNYLILPIEVVYSDKLTASDKFVYAAILWFWQLKKEPCAAPNRTIGKLAGVSPSTARDSISRLIKYKFCAAQYADPAKKRRIGIIPLVRFGRVSSNNERVSSNNERVSPNNERGVVKQRKSVVKQRKGYHQTTNSRNALKEEAKRFMEWYNSTFNRNFSLTEKRLKQYRRRRRNFSKREIYQAFRNLRKSAFHMGFNQDERFYATPDFLLRSDEQIDKWKDERNLWKL